MQKSVWKEPVGRAISNRFLFPRLEIKGPDRFEPSLAILGHLPKLFSKSLHDTDPERVQPE
jgi:hypothetical protein